MLGVLWQVKGMPDTIQSNGKKKHGRGQTKKNPLPQNKEEIRGEKGNACYEKEQEKISGREAMDGKNRNDVKIGALVDIVLKADQRSGRLTRGLVKELLTNSAFHPHGIKVRLEDGRVGRVQNIINPDTL